MDKKYETFSMRTETVDMSKVQGQLIATAVNPL